MWKSALHATPATTDAMESRITRFFFLWLLLPVCSYAEGVPCSLTLSHIATNAACAGLADGSINLSFSGENGAVTFLWSTGATSEDLSAIPSGTFTVAATDAMGCMAFDTITVGENTTISVDLGPDTAFCDFSGRVLVPVVAGATQYQWQNGASTNTLAIDAAGTYSVYVQNQLGCYATDTVVIAQHLLPVATIATTHPGCGAVGGMLDLSVAAGTPPFSYLWSTGATIEDLSAAPNGNYTVTVSDANACKAQTAAIVIAEATLSNYEIGSVPVCTADSVAFLPQQYGLELDGINDYLQIADHASIRPSTAFSVACWIMPQGTSGPRQVVLEKRTPAQNGYSIQFDPVSGLVHVRLQNGPLLSVFASNDTLMSNQWSHIALVVNGGTVALYVNGSLDHTVSYSGGVEITIGNPVRVGGGPNLWGFKGTVDEVVHWNIALNATEVAELYQKNLPSGILEHGFYLNFDETPGRARALDRSLYANNAQLVNIDTVNAWVQTNPMQLNYLWNFGDGFTSTDQHPLHGYLPGSWQTLTTSLEVTSSQGCQSVDSINLRVHAPENPFVNADSAAHYCIGDTVKLWILGGYATYDWSTGSTNDSINTVASGTYSVTAQDLFGCVHTGEIAIHFNPNSTPMPVVSPSGNLTVCLGDTLVLDAGTGYTTYLWNNGQTGSNIAVTDFGAFAVTVGNGFGCENTSDTVFVASFPSPLAVILANNDTLNAGPGIGFQWYLNGVEIPGAITHQYVAAVNGDYTVVVTGLGGCTTLSDPFSFTVGISDPMEWGFASVFPNPTQNQSTLRVFLNKPESVQWELYDVTGKLLAASTLKCGAGESLIDLQTESLAKGSYLLKVLAGNVPWVARLAKF
ncbi:MAG: hypothetical protein RLZZ519_2363 [Bacteroidota bacterium]|jgi:hypothetical protein